jgi:predicted RNA-binding Zn ribbon-like protein
MSQMHDTQPEPAGDPDLFLDFANTVELTNGVPEDAVPDGRSLRAWLRERSLISGRTSGAAVGRELREFQRLRDLLRDAVSRVADGRGPSRAQVRALNDVLRDGVHHHELHPMADGRFAFQPVGDALAQARSAIAGSLARYLADLDVHRLRVCASDGCRWLFVDRSPAGRRRWCDMRTCGNRAKVARHRARQASLSS